MLLLAYQRSIQEEFHHCAVVGASNVVELSVVREQRTADYVVTSN